MKKMIAIFAALAVTLALASCGDDTEGTSSGSSTPATNQASSEADDTSKDDTSDVSGDADSADASDTSSDAGSAAGEVTMDKILDTLGAQFTINDIRDLDYAAVGAVEGKSFTIDEIEYVVYKIEDQALLDSAKIGFITLGEDNGGTGERCAVNGNYVLILGDGTQQVMQAFSQIK